MPTTVSVFGCSVCAAAKTLSSTGFTGIFWVDGARARNNCPTEMVEAEMAHATNGTVRE